MGMMDFNLGDVGNLFTDLREAITGKKIEDPHKQAELTLKLEMIESDLRKAQMLINEKEAQHPSIFVAGWRPFIGWIGGVALAYVYIIQPFLVLVLHANKIEIQAPNLDIINLMVLVGGMLGFGGYRTIEKIKGKSGGD